MTGSLIALLLATALPDTAVQSPVARDSVAELALVGPVARPPFWSLDERLRPDKRRLRFIGGVVGVSVAANDIWQQNVWWRDRAPHFHVQNDALYARNIDKFGHAWTGLIISDAFRGSYGWAGVKPWPSTLIGAASSWLYMFNIEIQDGWGADYGFSPGDVAANSVGAFFPVLQRAVPPLGHVHLKWSYHPVHVGEQDRATGKTPAFVDDYEGHTYWLTADVNPLLPRSARRYWPEWLGVAVGMGVQHLDIYRYGYGNGVREVYLAPDISLLPLARLGPRWRFGAELFNHIHFPVPAVRLRPGAPVWYGLYF